MFIFVFNFFQMIMKMCSLLSFEMTKKIGISMSRPQIKKDFSREDTSTNFPPATLHFVGT